MGMLNEMQYILIKGITIQVSEPIICAFALCGSIHPDLSIEERSKWALLEQKKHPKSRYDTMRVFQVAARFDFNIYDMTLAAVLEEMKTIKAGVFSRKSRFDVMTQQETDSIYMVVFCLCIKYDLGHWLEQSKTSKSHYLQYLEDPEVFMPVIQNL